MKLTLPVPSKRQAVKTAVITSVVSITAIIALIGINAFFMNYYFDFQSPVIVRSPILLQKRAIEELVSPIPEEPEFEATESAEPQTNEAGESAEISYSPSNRLVAHTEQRPGVYAKIKEYFGDESVMVAEIISRESSLNPHAENPTSGAIGLFQRYPAETLLDECPDLNDVDCQMKNGKNYIEDRYGSVEEALNFWNLHGWY